MPTILVVDDTAVDRRLAGGLLEKDPELNVCYAENGQDALLKIGTFLPDLVLTDLQMPELDGLQLVNSIGERFPELPVVLMTAHGSENIAAQALAYGAASYVPKNELADSLVETVRHILSLSDSDVRYRKLIRCATKIEFDFALENELTLIDPLLDLVQQVIESQSLYDPQNRIRVGVALEHALHNAMIRGNLEIDRTKYPVATKALIEERQKQSPYKERRVHLNVLVAPDKAQFVIRDEGAGFDIAGVPIAGDPESFRDGIGRGHVLIRAFMDEVDYSASGNEVKLTKYATKPPVKPR
jgi:CheY-like chemotaxis protein